MLSKVCVRPIEILTLPKVYGYIIKVKKLILFNAKLTEVFLCEVQVLGGIIPLNAYNEIQKMCL